MFDLRRGGASGGWGPAVEARLLVVGHAGSPTGFSRVLHSLLRCLPAQYDVHHFGTNLHERAPDCGWTIHENPHPEDIRGASELARLVVALKPQLVFILDELWSVAQHYELLLQPNRRFRTVLYVAISEIEDLRPEFTREIADIDAFVVFTEFARVDAEQHIAELKRAEPELRQPPIHVIPHGVDTDLFFPLAGTLEKDGFAASRRQSRHLLFGPQSGLEEAFIVLNANRNQPFKRIDICLEGFAQFAHNKPADVKLYLHMGSRKPAPGVVPLVDQFDIRDRVLFTTKGDLHPSVPSDQLNLIYNACDVGINTSEGEGWGLISFEHGATGATQIVPRHSACRELWEDAAIFLEPTNVDTMARYQRAGKTVTVEGVAQALETLYQNRDERYRLARAAFQNATQSKYDWKQIALQWHHLFQQLLQSGA